MQSRHLFARRLSEASESVPPSMVSCCLAKASMCTQSTHGMALDHLALVVKKAGIPDLPWESNSWKDYS